jgi:hypothetical protein
MTNVTNPRANKNNNNHRRASIPTPSERVAAPTAAAAARKRPSLDETAAAKPPPPKQRRSHLQIRDLAKKHRGDEPTGFRLFRTYRKFMKLPEYPTDVEFKEDNLQIFFINLVNWASSRIIPYGFDIDLMPPANTTSHQAVMPTTVACYTSQSIQHLRRLFPEHEEFILLDPNDDKAAPEWWAPLSHSCEQMCERPMTKAAGDYTFGTADIRPLYTD